MKKIFVLLFSFGFYGSAMAQIDDIKLPIRLSSFDVGVHNNTAKLHWSTVCYLQYANFQIQVSADGENYTTIHSFTADKYRCSQPFDFIDSSPTYMGNIFYRINVGNIDGDFFASEVRSVYLKEKPFDLIAVYPTIATSNLHVTLSNDKNESFSAVVINGAGAVVKKQQLQAVKGVSRFSMNTSDLAAGYYVLRIFNKNGNSKTARFIR